MSMTMLQTTSSPAGCAVDILEAWRQNDLDQLNQELARASRLEASPASGSDECERAELLGGIAGEMKNMVAAGRMEDAGVYVRLLRHLANQPLVACAGSTRH